MSPLKTSFLIAILACTTACGRQVVEFANSDGGTTDGGRDGSTDAGADARTDAGIDIDGSIAIAPTVVSTTPLASAIGVAPSAHPTATFSKPMNSATLTILTFTLSQGGTLIGGTVALDGPTTTATFTPTLPLVLGMVYTATITTGAQDAGGLALAADHAWMFTTATSAMLPTVISTTPLDGATGVSITAIPSATFSKPMNAATIDGSTFTVSQGGTLIAGMVGFNALTNTATFSPALPLTVGLVYTAMITTGAEDTGGLALAADHSWQFTTSACGQGPITLGVAGTFAVLAGSTVTNTGPSSITGDLGVSPGTAVTGFPPGILIGTQHTDPTSATGIADLTTAYNEAAGRTLCAVTVAGNLGGMTLPPGLYKSTSFLEITSGDLTLDAQGDGNAVWVFQTASSFTTTIGRQVVLINGANAANVYWQVGSSATLGLGSVFHGTIMADQAISLLTGATLNGRALARIAGVTLDANTIVAP